MTLVSNISDLTVAIREKLNAMNTALRPAAVTVVIDGGGEVVSSGIKLDVIIPFDGVITSWTILADQVGHAVVDLWKTDYASAPPNVTHSIVADHKPVLNAAIKAQSDSLDDWTVVVQEGDVLRIVLNSASIVTRLTVTLQIMRA